MVYFPKEYVDEIENEIKIIKERIKSGEQPVFNNIDTLLEYLEEN